MIQLNTGQDSAHKSSARLPIRTLASGRSRTLAAVLRNASSVSSWRDFDGWVSKIYCFWLPTFGLLIGFSEPSISIDPVLPRTTKTMRLISVTLYTGVEIAFDTERGVGW